MQLRAMFWLQYIGSNIVQGVAESWVEAEMSWVEVDGAGWRWVHGLVIPIPIENDLCQILGMVLQSFVKLRGFEAERIWIVFFVV